jgi:Immunity protein 27
MSITPAITGEADIDAALFGMQKLDNDPSGWITLYVSPVTGQFWELSYPQGEMHGGGPRQLSEISALEARDKYANARSWKKPTLTKVVRRLNINSCCPVCRAVSFNYQAGANSHDQFGALVECPDCGWKGMLGDRDLMPGSAQLQ